MKIHLKFESVRIHSQVENNNDRATKKYGARGVLTVTQWRIICKAQMYACMHCHTISPLSIDHIRPLSAGGRNKPRNIQGLCLECNQNKGYTVDKDAAKNTQRTNRKCTYVNSKGQRCNATFKFYTIKCKHCWKHRTSEDFPQEYVFKRPEIQ